MTTTTMTTGFTIPANATASADHLERKLEGRPPGFGDWPLADKNAHYAAEYPYLVQNGKVTNGKVTRRAKVTQPANDHAPPVSDIGSREDDGHQPEAPLPSSNPEAAPETPRAVIRATPFVWVDPCAIPRRQWLYGHHYVRKFVTETAAQPGLGKSSVAIVEGLAIATGRDLLGVIPDERTNVWYWNGEDPMEELQRRIAAAALHYSIDPTEIEGRLFVDTGRETKIIIAEQTRTGAIVTRPVVDDVIATIRANDIGVMIIDPFVASHRVTENDNPAIELVAATWAEIADVTGCAIELVLHTRKTGGADVTVEDGRGGSALLGKVRSARVLNTMSEADAAKAGVKNRRSFFRVENGKASMTPPPDKSDWFQMIGVPLGNGDSVGVVTRWTWPDAFEGVTVSDLRAVQSAIAAGRWRENCQAKDWAGHAVARALHLDAADKAHRAKIVSLLKTWIANGMLVVVEGKDERHETRSYIEVGKSADD